MIKYLFIFFNSMFLLIYSLFSSDGGVTVTGNFPSAMNAGQEIPIELIVNKGSLKGFAKLQMEVPQGITIKESEDKGATYTFEEGIAKWVWAELPEENDIVIKLTIVAEENSSGEKTITAKYSYVDNNVKQDAEMSPAVIMISGNGDLADNKSDSAGSGKDTAIVVTTSNNEPPGNITVTRQIEKAADASEHLITLIINKGLTRGFARYSDDLPEGAIVKGGKTDGSSFSVADGKIKFVWVNVPEKEFLEVTYTISSITTATGILKGEYSYLENNQSKKVKLEPVTITFKNEDPQVAKNNKREDEKEPELTVTTKNTGQKLAENKNDGKKNSDELSVKSQNTLYMVQVGAFSKRKVTAKKLEKRLKLKETIRSEMQGGFTKFMVGVHEEYKSARDHRETVITNNGVKTAFVVAYNHGKRITVQEALMITNQQWFK